MNKFHSSKTLLAITLYLTVGPACADAVHERAVAETTFSADSDGLHERTASAGYIHPMSSLGPNAMLGLRAGYWLLDSPADHIEFGTLRLDHQNSVGPIDMTLQGRQLINSDWSPTLGSADFNFHLTPHLSVDASGESDIVDTVIAARHHTRVNTANLFTDYQLLDSVTVTGGVLKQWFSDGNRRFGRSGRVVYSPASLEGFNTQLRVRRIDSDFPGIGYFSPNRLEEALGLLQYSHTLPGERFVLTGIAGGGMQRVNGATTSPLYQAELRLRGWFTDHFGLEAKVGCANTGGLQVQAATGDYRNCSGGLSLIDSF